MADTVRRRTILVAASGFTYAPRASRNLGDRAQLAGSLERLKSAFPEWQVVALANSLNDRADVEDLEVSYTAIRYLTSAFAIRGTPVRLPARATQALRVLLFLRGARRVAGGKAPIFVSQLGRAALREIEETSALFLSGAGVFNDLYVAGVGGFWGAMVRCASALGKPVIASGQQIGPFERPTRQMLAKWALRHVDLLGVRDPLSLVCASGLGIPDDRVVLTGDDAWDIAPASPETIDPILARQNLRGPFIAAQLRVGPSVGWSETDFRSFAVSLDHLAAELSLPILFVPTATALSHDDRNAAARVREHLKATSYSIEEELDAQTTKAILGRAAVVVGTAYHFCVFAASVGTPVIGLHASPYMTQKIVGLAELWPNRVTALSRDVGLQPVELVAAARELLQHRIDGDTGKRDRPRFELRPNEPVQFLAHALAQAQDRPYSARFADRSSVDAYEREFQPGHFMWSISILERQALRSALERTGRTPFKKHLDFACGTGRAVGLIDGLATTTIGIDTSESMLRNARERFPALRFICGDISHNPHILDQIGPFDLVTLWRFVAPAEPELRLAALSAITQCMQDDGLLAVNNNANRTSLHGVAERLRARVKGRRGRRDSSQGSISHRQLCQLLESVGLLVEETRGICYLPEHATRRLPAWLWMPVERLFSRLNIAPRYSVNQLVIARRPRPSKC